MVTRRDFAVSVLHGLGFQATPENVRGLVAWARAEGGHWNNSARFNPLNTTEPAPGSSTFRSVGQGAADIRIYKTWQQGVDATVKTLRNGRYAPILHALRSGKSAEALANAIGQTPWGTSAAGVRAALGSTPARPVKSTGVPGSGAAGYQASLRSTPAGLAAAPAAPLPDLAQLGAQLSSVQPPPAGVLAAPAFAARPRLAGGFAATSAPPAIGPDVGQAVQSIAASTDTSLPATPATAGPVSAPAAPGAPAGAKGRVVLAPGAGRPLKPVAELALEQLAGTLGETLRVGTTTNHSYLTTSGHVSEHVTGNAGDIPARGADLTKKLAGALFTFGLGKTVQWLQNGGGTVNVKVTRGDIERLARAGGLFNIPRGGGGRYQVIGNSHIGGDHTTHLHVGVR